MSAAPTKALPAIKEFKSLLTRKAESQRLSEQQRAEESANRPYGEEPFTVSPLCAVSLEVVFPKELPQRPLVHTEVLMQSETSLFRYVTSLSSKGFSVTLHNTGDCPAIGSLMWFAFVRP